MTITHVAMWVSDLEGMREFYERRFGARAGARYENRAKGFSSYFLSFDNGARLELMRKDSIVQAAADGKPGSAGHEEAAIGAHRDERLGFAHLAFSSGGEAEVDRLTAVFAAEGIPVVSGPRRTGDGYYEAVIRDPEGNTIEITV